MNIKKYRVKEQRVIRGTVHAEPGDIVYAFMGCDYGLANDDTRATGIEHTTVTRSPTGGWDQPGFTIPINHLEEVP